MSSTPHAVSDHRVRASAVLVMASFLLLMAAVVAPGVDGEASASARTLGLERANRIASALARVARANGGTVGATRLIGPGVRAGGVSPRELGWHALATLLVRPASPDSVEVGDYGLDSVPVDPWGRGYIVFVRGTAPHPAFFVLSAGPDGVLDTDASATIASGDDLAVESTG